MDTMLQIVVPAFGGFIYALSGWWSAHKEEVLDVKKMLPTVALGAIFGIAGAMTIPELADVPSAFMAGLGGSVLIQKLVGGLK